MANILTAEQSAQYINEFYETSHAMGRIRNALTPLLHEISVTGDKLDPTVISHGAEIRNFMVAQDAAWEASIEEHGRRIIGARNTPTFLDEYNQGADVLHRQLGAVGEHLNYLVHAVEEMATATPLQIRCQQALREVNTIIASYSKDGQKR